MASVKLDHTDIEVLEVETSEGKFSIPLAKSLPYKKVKAMMHQQDVFEGFLLSHLPEKVVDEMTIGDMETLLHAWQEASGIALGES
ncbi:MAG: hypothetical protein HUJ70_08700 [Pseudobutyrivibrio sp.]|nr:hypothetical protein [Pseudobutyrivibrio sp.]